MGGMAHKLREVEIADDRLGLRAEIQEQAQGAIAFKFDGVALDLDLPKPFRQEVGGADGVKRLVEIAILSKITDDVFHVPMAAHADN